MYDANHPFHLHGYSFRVVAMGQLGRNTSVAEVRALDDLGKINRNLVDSPIKDTVTVPDGGYTVLRFHANNPGNLIFLSIKSINLLKIYLLNMCFSKYY